MASGSLQKGQNRPQSFEPRTPSGKAFLVWPWWILDSKAYIHYGPWLLCPDEPLKRLFIASASLKKAQNRPQEDPKQAQQDGPSSWVKLDLRWFLENTLSLSWPFYPQHPVDTHFLEKWIKMFMLGYLDKKFYERRPRKFIFSWTWQ